MTAAKMIGDWLGMWAPTKIAPTTPEGEMLPIMDISDEDRARALAAFVAKTKQSEPA